VPGRVQHARDVETRGSGETTNAGPDGFLRTNSDSQKGSFMKHAWRRGPSCLAFVALGCGSSGGGSAPKDTTDASPQAGGKGSANGGTTGASSGGTFSSGGAGAGPAGAGGRGAGGATDRGADAGGEPTPPPPKVSACDGLAADGVFEEITPPEVKAGIGTKTTDNQTKGGTFAIAVDPVNQGTIYAGTLFQKVWKSTDCGATWKDIATGTNGADVDRGMNWTFAIDPVEPEVVYTNSGYGSNGLFKSLDGGVNWTDVWSQKSQPELSKAFTYNFANVIAIDPANHLHVLLTFHEACLAPHPATCIVESMNGGSTWRLIDGEPTWNGNEGQVIFFLNDSKTWLWGSQTNGFWRSADSGGTWERIAGMTTSHLQGSELLRTREGSFFAAGADGVWRSPDGAPSTWTLVPDTGPIVGGLVSDGTSMFTSTCYFGNFCNPRYLRSPETDGAKWTAMKSPTLTQGGTLGYDKGHKLLYSSNLDAGLWRVVVR
jgi:hypothetical protein